VGGLVNDTWGSGRAIRDPDRYVPSFFVAAACFAVAALVAYFVAPRRQDTHRHTAAASSPTGADTGLTDHEHEVLGEMGPAATHDAHAAPFSLATVRRAARIVPMLMLVSFFTFLAIGLIAPYVKLFAMKRFDITESAFGTLLLYPALLIAVIAVPLGRLTDWWGAARSIHLGMIVCALSLWAMLMLRSEYGIVVLGGLLGTGFVLAFPAYMAYIADSAGERERGGVIGAVRMAQGFGAMLGTAVSPLVYKLDAEHLILFYLAATLLSLAALLSLLYVRKPRKPIRAAAS
jgi:predicted MFS family arabinose efflux permease